MAPKKLSPKAKLMKMSKKRLDNSPKILFSSKKHKNKLHNEKTDSYNLRFVSQTMSKISNCFIFKDTIPSFVLSAVSV